MTAEKYTGLWENWIEYRSPSFTGYKPESQQLTLAGKSNQTLGLFTAILVLLAQFCSTDLSSKSNNSVGAFFDICLLAFVEFQYISTQTNQTTVTTQTTQTTRNTRTIFIKPAAVPYSSTVIAFFDKCLLALAEWRPSLNFRTFQPQHLDHLAQWKVDGNKRNLNCFYSIFAKKPKSQGHFKCINNHKIIPRSCCLSATYYVVFTQIFFINFNDFESKLLLQHFREETQ